MSWLAQAKKNDKPVPMTTKCFGKIAPFALMGKWMTITMDVEDVEVNHTCGQNER